MRTLVIETATSACSVALFDEGELIDHSHVEVARGHAERLLPMIAALDRGGRADAIMVDVGPGSFTGVRVGVAAARALGFGWGAPAIGYASLVMLAAIDSFQSDTSVVIEGGHGEVFVGRYNALGVIDKERSMPLADAIAGVGTTRVIGNAAARLISGRGWGQSTEIEPDARHAMSLANARWHLAPTPFYGRDADAKPMA